MQVFSILASGLTAISFAMFLAIVRWAWSRRRAEAFEAAAQAPFALPDEHACAEQRR